MAGKRIELRLIDDPVTETERAVYRGVVDSSGSFNIPLDIKQVTQVFLNYGIYSGVLYAEPGRHYDLVLPAYADKSAADSLNPFYEPVSYFLRLKNPIVPELNDAIANFDQIFNAFLHDKFLLVNKYRHYTKVDTLAPFLDSLFVDITHPYFLDYKRYSIAFLETLTLLENHRTITKDYLLDKPILYNNTAYTHFFNQLFKDFIPYYASSRAGKRIVSDIEKAKSYHFAMETLRNDPVLRNDTLCELILLRGIYDALISEDLHLSSCFQTLDSIRILTKVDFHRQIVDNVKARVRHFAPGTRLPDFALRSAADSVLVNAKDLRGKMLYINFVNIRSYNAPDELERLRAIHKKHSDKLKVVTVAVGRGTLPKVKRLFSQKGFEWTLLDGTDDDLLYERFDLRSPITAYLTDAELNLLLSPAPLPSEQFDYYFAQVLRDNRIRELHNMGRQ